MRTVLSWGKGPECAYSGPECRPRGKGASNQFGLQTLAEQKDHAFVKLVQALGPVGPHGREKAPPLIPETTLTCLSRSRSWRARRQPSPNAVARNPPPDNASAILGVTALSPGKRRHRRRGGGAVGRCNRPGTKWSPGSMALLLWLIVAMCRD